MNNEQFVELIQSAGYDTRSYSGRGMYGNECLGVAVDNPWVFIADMLAMATTDDEVMTIADALRHTEEDALGLRTILYWRNVPAPEEEDDEDAS